MSTLPVPPMAFRAVDNDWQQTAWEDAADAMVISDPNGIVLAANRAYYRLYGYGPDQILGQHFAIIFPAAGRPQAVELSRAVFPAAEVPPLFESTIQRADGTELVVETRISFLYAGEQRVAMQSIIRDITAHKAVERAAERLARLQRLTANLADALTVARVAEVVLEQAVPLLGADAAALSLL